MKKTTTIVAEERKTSYVLTSATLAAGPAAGSQLNLVPRLYFFPPSGAGWPGRKKKHPGNEVAVNCQLWAVQCMNYFIYKYSTYQARDFYRVIVDSGCIEIES